MPAYDYMSSDRNVVLGHYSITQKSGTIATATAAASPLASFRWAPATPSVYAVLLRVKIAHTVLSTLSAGVLDFSGTVARNWTVDFSAANTQANMAGVTSTGAVRSNLMPNSQMGTKGPQICTTTLMSGQTYALDTDFMHAVPMALNPGTTVGSSDRVTLYDRALEGQHPLMFAGTSPCGYVIRNIAALPTCTIALYVTWEWAEVFRSAV